MAGGGGGGRRLAQGDWEACLRGRAELGVGEVDDGAAGAGVVVVEPVGGGLADAAGDAGFVDEALPFLGGPRLEEPGEAVSQLGGEVGFVLEADGVEEAFGGPLLGEVAFGEPEEVARGEDAHEDVDPAAVGALVLGAAEGEGWVVVLRLEGELLALAADRLEHGVEQRHLDALAAAAALAGDQRRDDAVGGR